MRLAAAEPQQAAAEHDGREIRLQRQRAAERLHHDHGLDRPAAEAAVLLARTAAEQAELGILLPQRAAPAVGLLRCNVLRALEVVVVGEQPLDARPSAGAVRR